MYLGTCHSVWNFIETQADHHGGEVVYALQGDLDTCCLVFLSKSVMWICLGYFLTNGTTLYFIVESGACIILSIIDLNCGKVDD